MLNCIHLTVPVFRLLRPFPLWQNVASDGIAIGNSEYEALQASFINRYTKGVSLIAGYTWAKLMTDISDSIWSTAGSIRSYYCVRREHSPGAYDVPHRFTFSAVGELPFGKRKMFGSSWNRAVDTILGGWQANGILTLASGVPLVLGTFSNNFRESLAHVYGSSRGQGEKPGFLAVQEFQPD
jgi:hypothetical protein